MKPIFYSSKEEIKNRIIKNAQDFWNIKHNSDFDPLVKLILEALSNELFNVSNDVKNLENRIFDKISRILAPNHLISALPAHAIMHGRTLENTEQINSKSQFYFKKGSNLGDQHKKTEIIFSPLNTVNLRRARIKYMASGHFVSEMDADHKKNVYQTISGSSFEQNTAYMGIEGLTSIKDIEGMHLFFDWKNFSVPSNSYDLLSLNKFFINDSPLSSFRDRFMEDDIEHKQEGPFHHKQLMGVIKADVQNFYSSKFLTLDINGSKDQAIVGNLPPAFDQILNLEAKNRLEMGITWVKIIFPAAITMEMLHELHIYMNAFPVVNKKLYQIKHRLKNMTSILPIKTEGNEQMLSVEKLQDNHGLIYSEIPYTSETQKADGFFSTRIGGTERFDSRNAKEMVDYLFELLRDEKAAFSAYGPDFLETTLKSLEQTIALIEQKSKGFLKFIKELPTYLVVNPIDDASIMFLDLWITQAELANGIQAGTSLAVYENNRFIPESLYLLSHTKGGRSRLNQTNRIQAYKYGLTTADRVVSKADIINFCKYELGEKIVEVVLEKGVVLGGKPSLGFIKTTDIIISPAPNAKLSTQDWDDLLEITTSKLYQRSTMNANFRMKIRELN